VACAGPSGGQTYLFIMLLDAPLCLLSYKVAHVGVFWSISCWHSSFLFFFSLFLRENAPLSFYFLLFIVVLGPIIKVLVVFNLVIEL
jgi:hypothetical protein